MFTVTNTAAVCASCPLLPIRRAHIQPLRVKFTTVLNVAGDPDATDAPWLATTTPLHTNSIVPLNPWLAVHVTLTGTLPARQESSPHPLHYGVWELPVSASLPLKSGWFTTGKRALSRRIERMVEGAGGFHPAFFDGIVHDGEHAIEPFGIPSQFDAVGAIHVGDLREDRFGKSR